MPEDRPATGTCMICGAWITPSFWVCADCVEEHGLGGSWTKWPAWAVVMRNDHLAERRQEAERMVHEVDVDPVLLERLIGDGQQDTPPADEWEEIQDPRLCRALRDLEELESRLAELNQLAAYSTKKDGTPFNTALLRRLDRLN